MICNSIKYISLLTLVSQAMAGVIQVRDDDTTMDLSAVFGELVADPTSSATTSAPVGNSTTDEAVVANAVLTVSGLDVSTAALNSTVVDSSTTTVSTSGLSKRQDSKGFVQITDPYDHTAAFALSDYMTYTVLSTGSSSVTYTGYAINQGPAVSACENFCAKDNNAGCNSFNVYAESSVDDNGVTQNLIKCSISSGSITAAQAVNKGQYRNGSPVAISNSIAYNRQSPLYDCPANVNCVQTSRPSGDQTIGGCALNAGGYMGYVSLGFYSYSSCWTACANTAGCVMANLWEDYLTNEYTESHPRWGASVCSLYKQVDYSTPGTKSVFSEATNCGPQDYPNGRHHVARSVVLTSSSLYTSGGKSIV